MSGKFIVILLAIQLANVFSAPAVEKTSTNVVVTNTSNVDLNALLQNESVRNLLLLLANQAAATKAPETKPIEKTTTVTETVTTHVEEPAVNQVQPPVVETAEAVKPVEKTTTTVETVSVPVEPVVNTVQPPVVETAEAVKPVEKTTTTVETVSVPVEPVVNTVQPPVVETVEAVKPVEKTTTTVETVSVPVEPVVNTVQPPVVETLEAVKPVEKTTTTVETVSVPVEPVVNTVQPAVVETVEAVKPVEKTITTVETLSVPVQPAANPVATSTPNVDANALLQNEAIRNLLLQLLANQGKPTTVAETKPIEKTTETTTVTETVTNPAVNTVIVKNPPQIGSRITEVTVTEAPASNSVVPVQPSVVVTYEPVKPVEKTTTTATTVSVPVQPEVNTVTDGNNDVEALLNSLTASTTTVPETKTVEAVPDLSSKFGSQPNTITITSTDFTTATPTVIKEANPSSTVYVHKPTEEEIKQERNAKYQFATVIEDGISGSFQERAEVRQNGVVYGKWSYDDGTNFRSTSYQADANGYRVTKEEVLPTRIKSLTGQAHVQTSMNGRSIEYRITENDIGALSRKGKWVNPRFATSA